MNAVLIATSLTGRICQNSQDKEIKAEVRDQSYLGLISVRSGATVNLSILGAFSSR